MAKANAGVLTSGLRGKAGSVVFADTPNGVVIKPRITPRNPRTEAQTQVRNYLAQAVAAYKTLTPEQAQAWRNYAEGQVRADVKHGTAHRPTAYAAFIGLASKFLQVSPDAPIPTSPPAFPFAGDQITLTATGGTGRLLFMASGGNSPEVRTELLLQPLNFGHQSPRQGKYRTQSFVAFDPGSLTAEAEVLPGYYAPAYRFVHALTGQEAGLLLLPVVLVTP